MAIKGVGLDGHTKTQYRSGMKKQNHTLQWGKMFLMLLMFHLKKIY